MEGLNASLSDVFHDVLDDPSIPEKDKSIPMLLQKAGKGGEEAVIGVQSVCLERIMRHLRREALEEYWIMEKTKHWGPLGRDNVRVSFCRYFMDIPTNRDLSFFDLLRFDAVLARFEKESGPFTVERIRRRREQNPFDFFGLKVPHWDKDRLQRYMGYLGARWTLVSFRGNGSESDFILADVVENSRIGDFTVRVLGKEWVRSPWESLMDVGCIPCQGPPVVRRESCENHLSRKWKDAFARESMGLSDAGGTPVAAVKNGLRRRTVECWNATGRKGYQENHERFLCLSVESIARNMAGRRMIDADSRNLKVDYPIRLLVNGSDDVPEVIDSILSDWVSFRGTTATMGWMAEHHGSDPWEAEAMFWCCLSDSFFPDPDDSEEVLPLTTDLYQTMGLVLIDRDGNTDLGRVPDAAPEVQGFLFGEKRKFMERILSAYAKNGLHSAEEAFRSKRRRTAETPKTEDRASYPVEFWDWVRKNHPRALEEIQTVIRSATTDFRSSLLEWARKNAGATKEDATIRDFIVRRYVETGVAVTSS